MGGIMNIGRNICGVLAAIIVILAATPATGQGNPGGSVTAEALDWLYVRHGPGIDYPHIGIITRGTYYAVLRRDPTSTWLEIDYPAFVGGRGWVYRDGVTLYGSLNDVPATTDTNEGYPTLTATPPVVGTSVPPWETTPNAPRNADQLDALSNSIINYLLANRFIPRTQRVGSVFFMDLENGESYSINPGFAYSGTSLTKLPILVALYRKVSYVPRIEQAEQIALMIICSENLSSNELLRFLGDGDIYRGILYVNDTLRAIGLRNTYLLLPYEIPSDAFAPVPTVPPISIPATTVDQTATNPDPWNQTTPDDMGWLLSSIYRCALNGTGQLTNIGLTMQKCRAMMRVLRANTLPAMIRAGVPDGIEVAHKHGWIDTDHGNAAIVSTPGGDYVLVIMLHERGWLNYEESFPVMAEISRMVYNAMNPAEILPESRDGETIPYCDLSTIDPKLPADLRAGVFPPIR
jgi:beta-lactamase class A